MLYTSQELEVVRNDKKNNIFCSCYCKNRTEQNFITKLRPLQEGIRACIWVLKNPHSINITPNQYPIQIIKSFYYPKLIQCWGGIKYYFWLFFLSKQRKSITLKYFGGQTFDLGYFSNLIAITCSFCNPHEVGFKIWKPRVHDNEHGESRVLFIWMTIFCQSE